MKKVIFLLTVCIAVFISNAEAQYCDPSTPTFYADLTGQPNGTWISPSSVRTGHCCGVTGVDRCIEFILTLDSAATGINFDISSGAVPPGALYYQVDCGPLIPVGSPICLSGSGPHHLTFCKPGNNPNEYSIVSISEPSVYHTEWASPDCNAQMICTGLDESLITWSSVPPNTLYNSFLDCPAGCDTVYVSPGNNPAPAFIDYQICSYPLNGCANAMFCDTVRIYFAEKLLVNINPVNPVICYGQPSTPITAYINGGLGPFHFNWSTGDTTQTINAAVGTYSVTVSDSLACDVATNTVTVSQFTIPITANAGNDQSVCQNTFTSAQLSAAITSASGATWSGTGIFQPSPDSLNVSYTPSSSEVNNGLANIQLITTGNSGCPADTDNVVIYIHRPPSIVISGSSIQCLNSISNYSISAEPDINYQWTVTGGTILNGNGTSSISINWNTLGTQTITTFATNQITGCDSTLNFTVTVMPLPSPIISGIQYPCISSNTNYFLQQEPNVSYTWNITGGVITQDNGNNVSVTWNSTGQQQISVTAVSASGCTTVNNFQTTVQPLPSPIILGDTVFCAMDPGTFTITSNSGSQYQWSVTGGNLNVSQNGSSAIVSWNGPGQASVTLTEISSMGCISDITMNLTILAQPAPQITGPAIICEDEQSTYYVTNTAGCQYHWQVTNGTISGANNMSSVNVLWNTNGNGTLTLTEVSPDGCDSSVTYNVVINPVPIPLISGNSLPCIYSQELLFVQQETNVVYSWTVTGGEILQDNGNSVIVNWITPGFGNATITATSVAGCTTQNILNTTIQNRPVPVISGNTNYCFLTEGTFSTPANPGSQYQWTVWGGNINGSANGSAINVQWNVTGQVLVTLTETNNNGCDSAVSKIINIEAEPAPVINGQPLNCKLNTSTYFVPPVNGHTYLWQVTGGNIISNNQNSIDVYWPAAGNGTVSVMEKSASGCDSVVMMDIVISDLPDVFIPPSDGCEPLNIAFSNNSSSAGDQYRWYFGDGYTSSAASPVHSYVSAGNYLVQLIVTNINGCKDSAHSMVTVYNSPEANFTYGYSSDYYYAGISQLSLKNLSSGASEYNWWFGDGETSTTFEPVHDYLSEGEFRIMLIVSNEFGCYDTATKILEVKLPQSLYVPNAFTPNADGVNDYFMVMKNNIKTLHIDIFNRWGEVIFSSDNPDFQWDAHCKGEPVQADVYVYRITAEGSEKEITLIGSVTVVR
jgi:gliding motility-associated-like protein